MNGAASVLAIDLGASSGRAVLGMWDGSRLKIMEVHRFGNDPVQVGNHLHWDILRLLHETKQGIVKAQQQALSPLQSMGIDSWAVDFGLLGKNGELLGNPYHYRDHHTEGRMEEVCAQLGLASIFSLTGLQFLPFNTLYQLAALKKANSPLLEQAETLLMIPDLLRYFLTGERKSEFTNATTTQLFNPSTRQWEQSLTAFLDLPHSLFVETIEPGTTVGVLQSAVCAELGVTPLPVIAVGEHDTASAVAGVPADQTDFAYLSCGTWSLLGTELLQPVLSEQALQWNFTNEGGVNQTWRLLKNIMGLWLIQECKRAWEKAGKSFAFAELVQLAEQEQPFQAWIDPDDPMFLNPLHMPQQIQHYCEQTNQYVPNNEGQIIRCIMESLALKYRFVLERTELLSGKSFSGLHMVGGGIQNTALCQYTANAIARPVWAGPIEASAIGNIVVQLIALGHIESLQEARRIIRQSFPVEVYLPQQIDEWNEAYHTFVSLTGL